VTRLLLVRHAPTAATERGAFAADEPIVDVAAAARVAVHLPPEGDTLSSPALRCRQTAAAVGREPRLDPALAECDFGTWVGKAFTELDRPLIDAWLGDPTVAPHGGESLSVFSARVVRWLQELADGDDGTVTAFTHGGVIRVAILHCLQAPLHAVWRLTAAPLSITELHGGPGGWTLVRANWTAES
jgi:broad specificity phosphatase PhoE